MTVLLLEPEEVLDRIEAAYARLLEGVVQEVEELKSSVRLTQPVLRRHLAPAFECVRVDA